MESKYFINENREYRDNNKNINIYSCIYKEFENNKLNNFYINQYIKNIL